MKKLTTYLLSVMMMLLFACSFTGIKVTAATAPAKVTGVKQIWADSTSFEVEWTALPGEDVDYQVEYSLDKIKWEVEESTATQNATSFDELKSGATYYVRIKSFVEEYNEKTQDWVKTYSTAYSDIIECVTTPEEDPEELNKTDSTTTSISLEWSAVAGANAYVVEYDIRKEYEEEYNDEEYDDEEYDDEEYDDEEYDDEEYDEEEYDDEEYDEEEYDEEYDELEDEDDEEESATKKRIVVKTNKVVLKGLTKNADYNVCVYAARQNSTGSYTAWEGNSGMEEESLGVTPSKMTGMSVEEYQVKKGRVVVKSKVFPCADGYEAQIWTAYQKNAKKDKKVTSAECEADTSASDSITLSLTKKALKKASFFKVRMRAYTLNSDGTKKYGAWSGWKHICQQPSIKKRQVTKNGIRLTWRKITGADRYTIYASTKKKSGYKKVGTTKKLTYTVKKFNKKKLKKGKTYYFYVVAENKVGKKFYSGEAADATKRWSKKNKY